MCLQCAMMVRRCHVCLNLWLLPEQEIELQKINPKHFECFISCTYCKFAFNLSLYFTLCLFYFAYIYFYIHPGEGERERERERERDR